MVFPLIPLALTLAGEFLPDLIRGIGGDKGGDIAEKIVNVATNLTGKQEPDQIMSALKNDPTLVYELQMQMSEERVAAAKYEYLDRASARRMAQKSPLHTWASIIVSILVTVGFGFALWAVLAEAIPAANKDIALILLGQLGAAFLGVIAFWVGSSRGSQEKTSLLAEAAKNS